MSRKDIARETELMNQLGPSRDWSRTEGRGEMDLGRVAVMAESPQLDKARGCLLGLAIGDALGAPLEGLTAQKIRDHYGCVDQFVDGAKAWRKKPFRWRLPGLYSDDTQQALALADVLLERGSMDLHRLSDLYVNLARPRGAYAGAHRAIGRSFRTVLNELDRGASPDITGQTSAGGGAATRIAPVAIYHRDDPDAMFDSILAASLMTHRDIRAIAGAFAVAHAVVRLLKGEPRTASLILRVAGDVAKTEAQIAERFQGSTRISSMDKHLNAMSRAIANAESCLDANRGQAFQKLVKQANLHGAEPVCRQPSMGFAPALIPTSLYLFLSCDSFEDALIEGVNLGGDADTIGSILGALAGAYHGIDAIPHRWLNQLGNRDGIDLRACALVQQSKDGLCIPDFLITERKLSEKENRNRDDIASKSQSPRGGDRGATRYYGL